MFCTEQQPFGSVAIDYVGPLPVASSGANYFFTVIDELSNFVVLIPTMGATATETARALLQISGRYGAIFSIKLMSDHGSHFENQIIDEYCAFFGMNHRYALPYRPQANGIVERANQEVLRHLRHIVFDYRVLTTWDVFLPMVQRIMNASFNTAINTSPARLIFGDCVSLDRGLLTAWDTAETPVLASEYVTQLNEQLSTIISVSSAFQSALHQDNGNKSVGAVKAFAVSDFVLISYPVRCELGPLLRGPYCVVEIPSTNTYTCQDLLTHDVITVDVSRLTRWVDLPAEPDPGEVWRSSCLRDRDEFAVDIIIEHFGKTAQKNGMKFRVRGRHSSHLQGGQGLGCFRQLPC